MAVDPRIASIEEVNKEWRETQQKRAESKLAMDWQGEYTTGEIPFAEAKLKALQEQELGKENVYLSGPKQWISREQYNKLLKESPEGVEALQSGGVEGYNKWVEDQQRKAQVRFEAQEKEQEEFKAQNVELRPGEWFNKQDVIAMTPEARQILISKGYEAYQQWGKDRRAEEALKYESQGAVLGQAGPQYTTVTRTKVGIPEAILYGPPEVLKEYVKVHPEQADEAREVSRKVFRGPEPAPEVPPIPGGFGVPAPPEGFGLGSSSRGILVPPSVSSPILTTAKDTSFFSRLRQGLTSVVSGVPTGREQLRESERVISEAQSQQEAFKKQRSEYVRQALEYYDRASEGAASEGKILTETRGEFKSRASAEFDRQVPKLGDLIRQVSESREKAYGPFGGAQSPFVQFTAGFPLAIPGFGTAWGVGEQFIQRQAFGAPQPLGQYARMAAVGTAIDIAAVGLPILFMKGPKPVQAETLVRGTEWTPKGGLRYKSEWTELEFKPTGGKAGTVELGPKGPSPLAETQVAGRWPIIGGKLPPHELTRYGPMVRYETGIPFAEGPKFPGGVYRPFGDTAVISRTVYPGSISGGSINVTERTTLKKLFKAPVVEGSKVLGSPKFRLLGESPVGLPITKVSRGGLISPSLSGLLTTQPKVARPPEWAMPMVREREKVELGISPLVITPGVTEYPQVEPLLQPFTPSRIWPSIKPGSAPFRAPWVLPDYYTSGYPYLDPYRFPGLSPYLRPQPSGAPSPEPYALPEPSIGVPTATPTPRASLSIFGASRPSAWRPPFVWPFPRGGGGIGSGGSIGRTFSRPLGLGKWAFAGYRVGGVHPLTGKKVGYEYMKGVEKGFGVDPLGGVRKRRKWTSPQLVRV